MAVLRRGSKRTTFKTNADVLCKILEEHEDWICTHKKEGKRADLSDADLSDADLSGADLRKADLSGANLTQVKNLSIEQLSKAKTLHEAKLSPELMKQKFASKNGIKTWLTIDELIGNPFVYEGKIIGVDVYFVQMVTATSGIFRPGGFSGAKHIVVSKIPKGLFKTSDARIILAGKVLGNTESIVPLLGSMQVPHLKFIDYMLPK